MGMLLLTRVNGLVFLDHKVEGTDHWKQTK